MKYKKIISSLIFICTLASCQKIQIPDDVMQFVYSCSLENAKSFARTISYHNSNVIYDEDGAEKGRNESVSLVDRTSDKEGYYFKKTDTYQGSQVAFDTTYSSSLYIFEKTTTISYDADNNEYVSTIHCKGYESLDDKDNVVEKDVAIYHYSVSEFESKVDNPIFYSSETSGRYTGGIYLADFFKNNISEFEHFTIKDDIFTYTISDQTYKSGSQSAVVNETLCMNSEGLLSSMEQNAINESTKVKNVSSAKVIYNATIQK